MFFGRTAKPTKGSSVYRKISQYLTEWKNSVYRKPLILQGARQVGKTYSVLAFGKAEYDNVAYFNFESDPGLAKTFDENIEPDYLIPILSRIARQSITKGRTLVVFDEVQLCERALTSLKYFCEQAPEYHIIAMGSLLGVAVNRKSYSFPVGKVDMKTLYPLDMEEFLIACGEGELVSRIRKSFDGNEPLPAAMHEAALMYYRQYLLIGGMPECVDKFIETKDYILLRHNQSMILESYMRDMSKYNTGNEIKKCHQVYSNITVQLSKKNTRFQYKLIKKGARAAEYENAIEWLALSGIITRIYRAERPAKPLDDQRDIASFKTYISDTGLLCARKEIVPEDILYDTDALGEFKGGMTENYVCGQLTTGGHSCYYMQSDRGAEIDFVLQLDGGIVPIEVKSAENTKAKSLNNYMKKYEPPYAIKLTTKNFGFEDGKKSVPLYAAFCI
jgi:predicted AAA+ superfamily ATPase